MGAFFNPDWASPPGDTIRDLAIQHKISPETLAVLLCCSVSELVELLDGNRELTSRDAYYLSTFLGGPVEFWLERERQYRERLRLLSL